jgi:hypothetical protein
LLRLLTESSAENSGRERLRPTLIREKLHEAERIRARLKDNVSQAIAHSV